jgi:hypothetical protein
LQQSEREKTEQLVIELPLKSFQSKKKQTQNKATDADES